MASRVVNKMFSNSEISPNSSIFSPNTKSASSIAVGLLARRDHSIHQIRLKLIQREFDTQEIEQVLADCIAQGYLDDARFAALVLRSQIAKGHGVNKIKQSMSQKGLSKEVIHDCLQSCECDWFELAKQKALKKFGQKTVVDQKDYAKRMRYLLGQGFDYEQATYGVNRAD